MYARSCLSGNEEIHPFTQNEKNDDGYI
jgi:hypothetical protein